MGYASASWIMLVVASIITLLIFNHPSIGCLVKQTNREIYLFGKNPPLSAVEKYICLELECLIKAKKKISAMTYHLLVLVGGFIIFIRYCG